MMLTLYYHPLSSFCWKVLIALYELEIPFERRIVDLANAEERAAFRKIWPLCKFPVLQDAETSWIVPESSAIIEYLETRNTSPAKLIPEDPIKAWEARLRERIYDLHVNGPMQKIVTDRLRTENQHDLGGVERARSELKTTLAFLEEDVTTKGAWAMGQEFSVVDCAAAPALFYADKILPLKGQFDELARYLGHLRRRRAFARVLREAEPYFAMFPA